MTSVREMREREKNVEEEMDTLPRGYEKKATLLGVCVCVAPTSQVIPIFNGFPPEKLVNKKRCDSFFAHFVRLDFNCKFGIQKLPGTKANGKYVPKNKLKFVERKI